MKASPSMLPPCPLCGRAMVPGPSLNEHHMVPKSHRGRDTVTMHRICHSKIHSVFSERELATYYHTIERLLERDEIRKFVGWVRKKDPEYFDRNRKPSHRR
ncbi:HNH endonuclease family protein [Noviherbaspirillum soli]|uniref:HNH endonuclease n=1 Tax=Noviherbaspirillum soli TaxID=1064518 RepID=UPI00188A430D|nr:HNH endonuclease [Noviherbaspirillum soli]